MHKDTIIILAIIYFGLLFLAAIYFYLFEKKWIKKAPYTQIISETIIFTGNILREKKIKQYPCFKVCYYKHKKYNGVFNGQVIVYSKNNPDIHILVDTVLHEVMHYIQSKTDKQFQRYSEYTNTFGYYNNPFEKESRAFAAEHRDECLKHLASKNLIIQK